MPSGPVKTNPCGTLDLDSSLTQHCFPADKSHHFVCCVDIQTAGNSASPHGNNNPLLEVITKASKPESYSWCTCSEEICLQQLGGRVAWNQHGAGWKGYKPDVNNVLEAREGFQNDEFEGGELEQCYYENENSARNFC